jgi:hypothetical protein
MWRFIRLWDWYPMMSHNLWSIMYILKLHPNDNQSHVAYVVGSFPGGPCRSLRLNLHQSNSHPLQRNWGNARILHKCDKNHFGTVWTIFF